ELIFGDSLTPAQRSQLARKVFENNARTVVEAVRWTPEWMRTHVILEGENQARRVIQEAASQGKGFIIISAHLGNFELLTAATCYEGHKCTILFLPQGNWRLNRLLAGARATYMPQT